MADLQTGVDRTAEQQKALRAKERARGVARGKEQGACHGSAVSVGEGHPDGPKNGEEAEGIG